jgi:hypothetical protein
MCPRLGGVNITTMRAGGKIFISYRRQDSDESAGRIRDWLTQPKRVPAGNLFMDVHDVAPGANFVEAVERAITQCRTMLVIIGPSWLDGPKSLSPYIQEEILSALRNKLQIIPVLVRGAAMPTPGELPDSIRELAFHNARKVRADDDFDNDMGRLASALGVRRSAGRRLLGTPVRGLITVLGILILAVSGLGVLSLAPEGNPVWNFVHSHVVADAGLSNGTGVNGWDNDGITCVPRDDGYHVIMNAGCGAPSYGVDTLSTYTVAVSSRELGATSNFYGIMFHYGSAGRYEFLISSTGDVMVQIVATGQSRRTLLPPEANPFIHTGTGASNRLEVRIDGSHMAFAVNGAVVGQTDDGTFSGGALGLVSLNANRVLTSEEPTAAQRQTGDVVFTDFKITAPLL